MPPESLAAPLFETGGPNQFREAVAKVGAEVGKVASAFDELAKRADAALGNISKKLDDVLAKSSKLSGTAGTLGTSGPRPTMGTGVNGGSQTGGRISRLRGMFGGGGGGMFGAAGISNLFAMEEMGLGVSGGGIGGMTTFGQLAAAGMVPSMGAGGVGAMRAGTPGAAAGGVPGYGQFSWGRAAVGAFTAAQGAAANATAQHLATGTTWRQMEFQLQGASGFQMGLNAAGKYASQFTGWNGDVSNLMAGIRALSGVPGVGLASNKNHAFARAASQAGAMAMISQAGGGSLTFADAAQAQQVLSSAAGRATLGRMGMSNLAPANTNLFSLAELTSQKIGRGRMLSAKDIATQSAPGGALYNTLAQMASQMGLSPDVVQGQIDYLERQAHGGYRNTLGSSGLTAKDEARVMKQLGYSGTDINKQFAAAESQARMGRTRAEGEADASSALNQAAEKLLQSAEALSGVSGGLGHALGMGTGALGSTPGGWVAKGLRVFSGITHLLGGSSSSGNAGGYSPTSSLGTTTAVGVHGGGGASVVNDAMKYLGVPYKWGGTNPRTGLDCSGLVQLAYKDVGISLPRTSQQMARVGTAINSLKDAAPGDLLFFAGSDGTPSSPGHVGIYAGGNKMIDAPHTGSRVQIEPVWSGLVGIRRVMSGLGASGNNSNAGGATPMTSRASGGISSIGGSLSEGNLSSESAVLASTLTATFGSVGATSGTIGGSPGNTMGVGSAAPSSTPVGPIPGGGHLQLIKQSLGLAGIADTPANESAVNLIVTKESGWNPNSVNNWDSNAKAGHPSQGLMQMIPGTFKAHAIPGYNKNILDPLSNLISGERYAVSRYGSLSNVPGVRAVARGGAYVGYQVGSQYIERDHLAMLHRGEMVVRAGTAAAMRMNQMSGGGGGGVSVVFQKGAVVYSPGGEGTAATPSPSVAQDMDDLAARLESALQKRLSRVKVAVD